MRLYQQVYQNKFETSKKNLTAIQKPNGDCF